MHTATRVFLRSLAPPPQIGVDVSNDGVAEDTIRLIRPSGEELVIQVWADGDAFSRYGSNVATGGDAFRLARAFSNADLT